MEIKEMILQTSRLEELRVFYSEILGLAVEKGEDQSIIVTTGSSKLIFSAAASDAFYHFAFNIPANKIEEAREWLNGKIEPIWMHQYNSDIADFATWHAKSVYFFDPAGNIVELIARFDTDTATGQSFSSNHFLSISEAGIVLQEEQFEDNALHLMKKFNLDFFAKQPPQPHFKAMGDDNGLFIVVPADRNWFPTSIPSGIFPMEVKFKNKGKDLVYRNY